MIKRYNMELFFTEDPTIEAVPSDDGEWVKWEDVKDCIMEWQDELPDTPGRWICVRPDGEWWLTYVTKKDIELVNGDHPLWLGGKGKWCGPIESLHCAEEINSV
jgi:hypothetical protein